MSFGRQLESWYLGCSLSGEKLFLVVPKRAALLFDQLMVALQKVVDNQGKGAVGGKVINKPMVNRLPATNLEVVPVADDQMVANSMDLQRRGQYKSESFWKCFVNALACFKKK